MGPGIEPHPADRRSAGFTLIELLVVIAIVAVLAVGTGLAVGRGASGSQADLTRFRDSFEINRAQAVEGRELRGLVIAPRGLQVVRYGADGWGDPGPVQRWRGKVSFAAQAARALPPGTPDILFFPDGRSSAFSVLFSGGRGQSGPVRCASDGWTGLTCAGG